MAADNYINKSIYFSDPALLEAAIAKAKAQRRSLSNYICGLLEADLDSAGIELQETASSKTVSDSMIQVGAGGAVSYLPPKRAKKSAAPARRAPVAPPKS